MNAIFDPSKLKANMEAIRQRMGRQAKRRAVVRGARVIGGAMIERTPVQVEKNAGSDALEPGEVKESIKVRVRSDGDEEVARVGPTGSGVARVAHNVEYGHRMVSGGTSRLNVAGLFSGTGKEVGEVPAHPFLRPAYESSAGGAIEAMAESYAEDLKKGSVE